MPHQEDPLWKLRHALVGLALALLLALLAAAAAASVLGDLLNGGYGTRAAIYCALLLYTLIGAAVLFTLVAQHETQRVSPARITHWFLSLWIWPLLLLAKHPRNPPAG